MPPPAESRIAESEVHTMMNDVAWFALVGVLLPTIAAALLGRRRQMRDALQSRADARAVARMDADKG